VSIVIGIDASLTGTAVCEIREGDTDNHCMDRFSSVPAPGVRGRIDRCSSLIARVMDEFSLKNGREDVVVFIEGYSFASPNVAHYLGELGGLLRSELLFACKDLIEVPPSSLKKFISGTGNAKKEQMIAHVAKRWGHIFATNDECDAFSLAHLGLRYLGLVECDNQTQREVIAKLKNPAVKKSRKRKAVTT
jgi:crossover junction endodeoxyribonuclease RuvC